MKTITFKVSKSGVYHYKDFRINDNGLIKPQVISFSYSKNEDYPVIKEESTVEEVLSLLKDFAYNNKAYVYEKEGLPLLVNQEMLNDLNNSVEKIEDTIKKEVNKLFEKHLNKILGKYKIDSFDILIKKNGKYVNLSQNEDKHYAVNYLCHKLLYRLGKVKNDSFDNETGHIKNYFDYFIGDLEKSN